MLTRIAIVALMLASPVAIASEAKVHVATCKDGKEFYTSSVDKDGKPAHIGACRGHGGVAKWADGSPVKSHEKKGEYR